MVAPSVEATAVRQPGSEATEVTERKVVLRLARQNDFVGINIRGGKEFGLGIYISRYKSIEDYPRPPPPPPPHPFFFFFFFFSFLFFSCFMCLFFIFVSVFGRPFFFFFFFFYRTACLSSAVIHYLTLHSGSVELLYLMFFGLVSFMFIHLNQNILCPTHRRP